MSMSSVLSILSMDLCSTESKTTLLEKYLKRIHNTEILRFSFVVGVCVWGGGRGALGSSFPSMSKVYQL